MEDRNNNGLYSDSMQHGADVGNEVSQEVWCIKEELSVKCHKNLFEWSLIFESISTQFFIFIFFYWVRPLETSNLFMNVEKSISLTILAIILL